jgi:hypothetical protein
MQGAAQGVETVARRGAGDGGVGYEQLESVVSAWIDMQLHFDAGAQQAPRVL